jgi:hypothetical protein
MKALTWSCGGGEQSVAIGALIGMGELPCPGVMVMADTGREQSAPLAYLRDHLNPFLKRTVGKEIVLIDQSLATVGLYSFKGELLIPAFTRSAEGNVGKLHTYCSNEWKKRVIGRYLRSLGYGPKRPVITWIGISVDEVGRAKPSGTDWQEYTWPLLFDRPTRRAECAGIIARAGLPPAARSSCWMCPLHHDNEWRDIRDNAPEDWKRAVAFDEAIRARDPGVFVHSSAVPLAEADLSLPEPAPDLFGGVDGCDSGHCFV